MHKAKRLKKPEVLRQREGRQAIALHRRTGDHKNSSEWLFSQDTVQRISQEASSRFRTIATDLSTDFSCSPDSPGIVVLGPGMTFIIII